LLKFNVPLICLGTEGVSLHREGRYTPRFLFRGPQRSCVVVRVRLGNRSLYYESHKQKPSDRMPGSSSPHRARSTGSAYAQRLWGGTATRRTAVQEKKEYAGGGRCLWGWNPPTHTSHTSFENQVSHSSRRKYVVQTHLIRFMFP
jgi:hypothetical protein